MIRYPANRRPRACEHRSAKPRGRGLWLCVAALAVVCGVLGPVHRAVAHDSGAGPHLALVAVGGYSLVAAVEQDRLVLGSEVFYVLLGSSEYHFVNVEEAAAFESDPAHYLDWGMPRYRMLRNGVSLGGYSPVALVDRNELQHGSRDLAIEHRDRRYYLATAAERAAFEAAPARYSADLTARLNAALQKRDEARAAARAAATTPKAASQQVEPDGDAR